MNTLLHGRPAIEMLKSQKRRQQIQMVDILFCFYVIIYFKLLYPLCKNAAMNMPFLLRTDYSKIIQKVKSFITQKNPSVNFNRGMAETKQYIYMSLCKYTQYIKPHYLQYILQAHHASRATKTF